MPARRRSGGWIRRIAEAGLALLFLGGVAVAVAALDRSNLERIDGNVTVNDGDSLTIDGRRIRLVGIDAPELDQTCTDAAGRDYACGRRARSALAALVARGKVRCESAQRDRYDRLLAVCYADRVDINAAMVEAGWAVSYGDYLLVETQAREAGSGLWAGRFDSPRDWRARYGGLVEVRHDAMRLFIDRIIGLFRLG